MSSISVKTGHFLAKVLGIKLNENSGNAEEILRGESVFSVQTVDSYIEPEPTSAEWIWEVLPGPHDLLEYARSLFPFTYWIANYNLQWLIGDLVAGITIGAVVVPQGMAYASLANLAPQFGLYSSFMGVLVYWFFATSKDITIGPVAVASTLVGTVVLQVQSTNPEFPANVVASSLAVICGCIIIAIGLVRCGWIVELIPLTAISAFMTGSALNIAVGQVPGLLGETGFSSRDSTYLVVINILKHLNSCTLDAAMGLTALFMLYLIRSVCKYGAKRLPSRRKGFFFISTLRTVFVILLYTLISYLVNRNIASNTATKAKFKILGTVPRGFQNAAVPTINKTLLQAYATQIPVLVIVLLIEHIAIAKSFGRVNNYVINPSQELVAIGITNILGPFLGAYPATGSFSRTAIKSKAGVRTPLAGVITAIVVLLAIYALPAVFYWIPNASLAGVIIHAVGDLITPPNTVYRFWRVSPLEVPVFFIGVIVTVFSSIENGIYCTISISAAILIFRVIKARGRFLGKVKVYSVVGDHKLGNDPKVEALKGAAHTDNVSDSEYRDIFIPIDHRDGSNPKIRVESPYEGIFIYRFLEGFNYPNANHYLDHLTNYIFANTRRTNPDSYPRLGDRPWNDSGPRRGKVVETDDRRPTLQAVILDFNSVNNVDVTSIQQLIDVRNQLDRYASPDAVDWHFACINNRWTKRALVSAGFGYPSEIHGTEHHFKPIFSVAEIGGSDSASRAAELEEHEKEIKRQRTNEIQHVDAIKPSGSFDIDKVVINGSRTVLVHSVNRPLFHMDLTSALESAIASAEARKAFHAKGGVGIGQVP